MQAENREALLRAVNTLVDDPNGTEAYKRIVELLKVADKLGVRFTGADAVLNPLVDVALEDPIRFQRVIELIERKRGAAGLAPLVPEEDQGYDKVEYMRDFMAQKRERERRAAAVENLMRPEHAQLRGRARIDFMQTQSARWKTQRDAMLKGLEVKLGRKLKRTEIKDLLGQFWTRVDRELEELEVMARAEKTHAVR